jgi:hypothetical protein
MRPKKIVAVSFALLVILSLPLAVSAAKIYRFSEKVAFADFINRVDECTTTHATVAGTRQIVNKTEETVASGYFTNYNACTGAYSEGTGYTVVSDPTAFTLDKQLKSARLAATVPMYDINTGYLVGDMHIDLTWTGTGELSRDPIKRTDESGKCKVKFSSKGTSRLADVSGSITVGTTEYALGQDVYSVLVQSKNSEMYINCD